MGYISWKTKGAKRIGYTLSINTFMLQIRSENFWNSFSVFFSLFLKTAVERLSIIRRRLALSSAPDAVTTLVCIIIQVYYVLRSLQSSTWLIWKRYLQSSVKWARKYINYLSLQVWGKCLSHISINIFLILFW